jgi:hypothetical protein
MTPRQCYQEIARVLGKQIGPESRRTSFVRAAGVRAVDLRLIQAALLLILEKIDYHRAHGDFGTAFGRLRPGRAPQNLTGYVYHADNGILPGGTLQGGMPVPFPPERD